MIDHNISTSNITTYETSKLKIKYIPTAEMTADGFTKPIDRTKFDMFKDHLGMDTRPEGV